MQTKRNWHMISLTQEHKFLKPSPADWQESSNQESNHLNLWIKTFFVMCSWAWNERRFNFQVYALLCSAPQQCGWKQNIWCFGQKPKVFYIKIIHKSSDYVGLASNLMAHQIVLFFKNIWNKFHFIVPRATPVLLHSKAERTVFYWTTKLWKSTLIVNSSEIWTFLSRGSKLHILLTQVPTHLPTPLLWTGGGHHGGRSLESQGPQCWLELEEIWAAWSFPGSFLRVSPQNHSLNTGAEFGWCL